MKKIMFAAVSALALSALADGVDSTQFGILRVPSTAATTIVAVPWLASSNETSSVKVADFVLTADLTAGDELYAYEDGAYKAWNLVEGTGGVLVWEPANNVTVGGTTASAGADDATLKMGQAIMLKRKGTDLSKGFCIMGRPPTEEHGSLTLPSTGSLASPVYALVAPPFVTDTDVNSLTWSGLRAGNDQLIPAVNKKLTWLGSTSKWSGTDETRKLSKGVGAWFVSRSAGEKSVSW